MNYSLRWKLGYFPLRLIGLWHMIFRVNSNISAERIRWVRLLLSHLSVSNQGIKRCNVNVINANFSTQWTALEFKFTPKVSICWCRHKSDGYLLGMDYVLHEFDDMEDENLRGGWGGYIYLASFSQLLLKHLMVEVIDRSWSCSGFLWQVWLGLFWGIETFKKWNFNRILWFNLWYYLPFNS